jgi:hypothetical protein
MAFALHLTTAILTASLAVGNGQEQEIGGETNSNARYATKEYVGGPEPSIIYHGYTLISL